MAAPPSSQLQSTLQAVVQSVQWTYSLFWKICPKQGILVWANGYYNGAIKTRKTVQPMEVSADEASLQRSQQLRELYDSLSAGETNQPTRRPSAALSPEDLTESEWFYLMCVSFSFPPGVGLPGKAYARRQHVWLTAANEADGRTFSRVILAKSARIQTVVCIPLMDGVVELGTTDKVQEDLSFIQHVKTFFAVHQHHLHHPQPSKQALSEHSTSNPATLSELHPTRFHSLPITTLVSAAAADPPANTNRLEEEDDDEEDEGDDQSGSETETGRNAAAQNSQGVAAAGPSELMQLEMSEDILVGSPDGGKSNNLDSDFNLLAVTQSGSQNDRQIRVDSFRAEFTRRSAGILPRAASGNPLLEELSQDDAHYSQTVSTIIQNQASRHVGQTSTSNTYIPYSTQSAFAHWTTIQSRNNNLVHHMTDMSSSQWLLKYILFTVPFLHSKNSRDDDPTSTKSQNADISAATRLIRKSTTQDHDLLISGNHVMAEHRRREKLNERFVILRSLVPFVTKMDEASILGDTIEYVTQLRKKIEDLKTRNKQMEVDQHSKLVVLQRSTNTNTTTVTSGTSKDQQRNSGMTAGLMDQRSRAGTLEKRKMRILDTGGGKPKMVVENSNDVQVSIIESDALLEMECGYKEGLLLDVVKMLRDLRIETTTVQSSLNNGVFSAELRAKVKENVNGKKASIVEAKRAIHQIIPHSDT